MRRDEAGIAETLAIPAAVRAVVDERDGGYCRMCGKYLGQRRALHHIFYGGDDQGIGGRRRHEPANLISLCWTPYDNGCHATAHADKKLWQPILAGLTAVTGLTGLQVARIRARREGR